MMIAREGGETVWKESISGEAAASPLMGMLVEKMGSALLQVSKKDGQLVG